MRNFKDTFKNVSDHLLVLFQFAWLYLFNLKVYENICCLGNISVEKARKLNWNELYGEDVGRFT